MRGRAAMRRAPPPTGTSWPGCCPCAGPLLAGNWPLIRYLLVTSVWLPGSPALRDCRKARSASRTEGTRMNASGIPRPSRRGVLKAGLMATAVAGTGAWAKNPGDGPLRQPGSLPFPWLAAGTDTMPRIEHIVVLMQENHSYDNYLGMLRRPGADGFRLGWD